ncbi:MAG: DUF1819 family protein [Ruminococcus flavefaciens]|nr:DUF1819 family protein [Ruminococcus flavefaciens]
MITEVYSAGLISESFWFVEFKEYLKLIKSNEKAENIRNKIVADNLFGAPNEYRAERIYGYIKRRAETMSGGELQLFFSSDLSTQKIMNFICILRNSRILFEFVNEVYYEKIVLGAEYLERSDVNIFFKNKDLQSEEVAGWKEATKKRMCSAFFTLMTEANLLALRDRKRIITPPIIDTELEQLLELSGETDIIKALTGAY